MNAINTRAGGAPRPAALLAFSLLILTGGLLAVAVLLSKLAAVNGAPMLWYLTAAMGGAGLILFANTLRRGDTGGAPLATLGYSIGAGALMALGSMLGYISVGRVGAAFIALTMAFPTLLTYLLALAVRMERPRLAPLAGVAAGLAGGVWLALAKSGHTLPSDLPAVGAACLMPLILAVGNIFRTRFWPSGSSPRFLAGAMLIAGAGCTAPFALWYDGTTISALWTEPVLPQLLIITILSFTVQYVALFRLQQVAGPVYLSQIGSVAAVAGGLIAVVALDERLPDGFVPAAACIAVGVAFFQYSTTRH